MSPRLYTFTYANRVGIIQTMTEKLKTRLILIEGIPGSGKTTFAEKLNQYLVGQGKTPKLFREGDKHPADLAWHAYLTDAEFEDLTGKYPEYAQRLRSNAIFDSGHVLVSYTNLGFWRDQNELMRYLQQKEVFDGKLSPEAFMSLYMDRWKSFAKCAAETEDIYIFECVYMQNQVNELVMYSDADTDCIASYLSALAQTVKELNPVVIYLTQPDPGETIRRVAAERIADGENRNHDWINLVIDYVEHSPYGKKHGLAGYDGTIRYFAMRRDMELELLKRLPVRSFVVENRGYDYDAAFEEMIGHIKEYI